MSSGSLPTIPSVVFAPPTFVTISAASATALQRMADCPLPEPTEAIGEYFALEVAKLKSTGAMQPNEVIIATP